MSSSRSRYLTVVVAWLLVLLLPELAARGWPLRGIAVHGRFAVLFYFAALAASLCLWLALASAIARVGSRGLRLLLVFLVAVFLSTFTVGVLGYRLSFGLDTRPIVWAYLLDNPSYTLALLFHSMNGLTRLALFGTPFLLFAVFAYATAQPLTLPVPRWLYGLAVIGSLALVSLTLTPLRRMKTQGAPPDLHGLHTFLFGTRQWLASDDMPTLPVPKRAPLAEMQAQRRPDVVLIIHESLSKKLVAPWSSASPPITPKVATLLAEHADHAVWFPHAMTVAPVTNVALPALLTGLSAEAPRSDYARAPLVWEEARARGYASAFFSAEDYNVAFFRGFFLKDSKLDEWATAPELAPAPRVNDSGVEDSLVVDRAVDFIENTPADRPLFLVVQFNATHWPCWAPALRDHPGDQGDAANAERLARCTEATRYVDAQQARLWEALDRRGRLEQTLLLGTSDHGESFDRTRPLRPVNYYDSVLTVPLWVHFPKSLAAAEPALVAALQANRDAPANNIDLYPTLLDLWGQWPQADVASRPRLAGTSLFRPIPVDRVTVATSCSAIYEAASDGFALYHGRWKWLFDDLVGNNLFDVAADPYERKNLIASPPPDERAFFLRELPHHPRPLGIVRTLDPALLER